VHEESSVVRVESGINTVVAEELLCVIQLVDLSLALSSVKASHRRFGMILTRFFHYHFLNLTRYSLSAPSGRVLPSSLDQFRNTLDSLSSLNAREEGRSVIPHFVCISLHHGERCSHVFGDIDL
jgi:hypothetical protein